MYIYVYTESAPPLPPLASDGIPAMRVTLHYSERSFMFPCSWDVERNRTRNNAHVSTRRTGEVCQTKESLAHNIDAYRRRLNPP